MKRPRLLLIIALAMLAAAISCFVFGSGGTIDVSGLPNDTVILQLANSPAGACCAPDQGCVISAPVILDSNGHGSHGSLVDGSASGVDPFWLGTGVFSGCQGLITLSCNGESGLSCSTALVRSFETRAHSGLHYEATRPSLAQQAVIRELREVIADYDEEGTREMGEPHLRHSDALKALVFVLRLALDRSSGRPLSRGFLDFLRTEFKKDGSNTQTRLVLP